MLDTTRCQSSERKGNLFLLLCIAHTCDGALILRHEINYTPAHWKRWLDFLKLYLTMGEWFHDTRSKEEVECARVVVSEIVADVQKHFPRADDTHGYNIPKMHALAKMIDYIMLFGSTMNFYGGPGESSHKGFVKAPGLKTQRRVSEFASQVADQYYNMIIARKACKYVDIRLPRERVCDANSMHVGEEEDGEYYVEGSYTIDIYPNGTVKLTSRRNKHLEKYGLDETLVTFLRRLGVENDGDDDGNATHRYYGYTRATVFGDGGEHATYNAHPHYHDKPWYDWAYVHYEIEEEYSSTEQYFPSKILGFIRDDDDEVHAVIQCAVNPLPWEEVEEKFIAKFELCNTPGKEYIVPLSSLSHPICVVPDYGSPVRNMYMLILPKGQWSEYFARQVNKLI